MNETTCQCDWCRNSRDLFPPDPNRFTAIEHEMREGHLARVVEKMREKFGKGPFIVVDPKPREVK